MNSKKRKQRRHAMRRLRQRYQLELSDGDVNLIIRMIQGNAPEARFVARHSNRATEWNVPVRGMRVRVIYDKLRKEVVTALPPDDKRDIFALLNGRVS